MKEGGLEAPFLSHPRLDFAVVTEAVFEGVESRLDGLGLARNEGILWSGGETGENAAMITELSWSKSLSRVA